MTNTYGNTDIEMSNKTQTSKGGGGWKSAIFIIFVEMGERFAFYGVSGNLITYLTNVLAQPTATAAKNVNIWRGVSSVFPIFGALVADSYLGRFKTILLSTIIYLMGLILLTVSSTAASLQHSHPFFFLALYIIAIGEGGHKPCVQTFAADQFDEDLPEEKAAKSSFFNWWYLGIVVGATTATLAVIYVQEYVGWAIGYGIVTAVVAVALGLFLIGSGGYRRQVPVGSPFTRVAQVVVAAVRKWRILESNAMICYEGSSGNMGGRPRRVRTLARTHQFRFLDKATMIDETDKSSKTRNPWRLCSVNQVEQTKLLFRLVPIWLTCLMFAVVTAQLSTYFTKQGSTMNRTIFPHFQIPAASFQVSTGFTILISVPLYDRFLVPIAKNITGHPSGITMLQRIGVGLFLSALSMVISALVEAKRVKIAQDHGLIMINKSSPKSSSTIPMSIWWLFPQYVVCGLSDVFAVVGMQELFYDQMPEEMRSMGAAASISVVGMGNFLSSAVISIVQVISSKCGNEWLVNNLNEAHLDYFYWVLAGLSGLNLCVYVLVARGFVYKKSEGGDDDDDPTHDQGVEEICMHGYMKDGEI